RMPGDASQFAKAKAERFPDWNCRGMFVHSSREPDWIWEAKPQNFHGQVRGGIEALDGFAEDLVSADLGEAFHGKIVDRFRIVPEKSGTNAMTIKPGHRAAMKGV